MFPHEKMVFRLAMGGASADGSYRSGIFLPSPTCSIISHTISVGLSQFSRVNDVFPEVLLHQASVSLLLKDHTHNGNPSRGVGPLVPHI